MHDSSVDLGRASAAEMGTSGDVELGTAERAEMMGGGAESADDSDTLAIYNAKLRQMIRLRKKLKDQEDAAKETKDDLAAVEAWVQEQMVSLNKQTEYAEGHTISITRKFSASILAENRDFAVPVIQGLGWDNTLNINPQSLSALIRGKMGELSEQGSFDFGELSENRVLAEKVAESLRAELDADTPVYLGQIEDEQLRGDVLAYVATPLELRPVLRTFTKVGLSVRKK